MKVRNLFFAVLASAAVLVGCQEKEDNLGPASLKVLADDLNFTEEGGDKTFSLKATRDWEATLEGSNLEGVAVSPMSGKGSNDAQTITVHMGKNDGANRTVKINIKSGTMNETVTATQAGAKGNQMTIADALASAQGTEVTVNGLVSATNVNSFVMTDGTDNIVVYFGSDATENGGVKIGDEVKVAGKIGAYDNMPQIIEPTATVVSSENTVERGEAFELTGDNVESMDITKALYLKVTGVYSKSTNSSGSKTYHNLAIEGTDIQGSIAYPDAATEAKLAEVEGHSVTIKGYFGGGAGTDKNNMFRNIIVVDITDNGEPEYEYTEVSASEFYSQAENTRVSVRGTVMAINQKGFMVGDASAVVYVHQNEMPSVKVGNTVIVKGVATDYFGFLQIGTVDAIDVTSDSEAEPTFGEPTTLDATNIESWLGDKAEYVTFSGTLTGGRYVNLDGTQRQAMLNYTIEDYNELNDTEIKVFGYSMSVNTSSNNVAIMVVKVEGQPYLKALETVNVAATATEAVIEVKSNVNWTYEKTSGDWVTSHSVEGNSIKVSFTANEGEARTAVFTLKAEGLEDVVVNLVQAKPLSGDAQTATLNFVGWNFDGADKWESGYANHVVEFDMATVEFTKYNKQQSGNTIDDCPVTKGNPCVVKMKNGAVLTAVKVNLRQWATKAQTVSLYASKDGGSTFEETAASSDNFTLDVLSLPEGTNAFKLGFSSDKNQVGLASIELTYE